MSSVDAVLNAMAAQARSLRDVAAEVATEAAPAVEAAVRRSAAAGTTVEGKAWPPKRDGSRALPGAAEAITARAVGTAIVVSLAAPYTFHNAAKGDDRRRILPEEGGGVPPAIAKVLDDAAKRVWARKAAPR